MEWGINTEIASMRWDWGIAKNTVKTCGEHFLRQGRGNKNFNSMRCATVARQSTGDGAKASNGRSRPVSPDICWRIKSFTLLRPLLKALCGSAGQQLVAEIVNIVSDFLCRGHSPLFYLTPARKTQLLLKPIPKE